MEAVEKPCGKPCGECGKLLVFNSYSQHIRFSTGEITTAAACVKIKAFLGKIGLLWHNREIGPWKHYGEKVRYFGHYPRFGPRIRESTIKNLCKTDKILLRIFSEHLEKIDPGSKEGG